MQLSNFGAFPTVSGHEWVESALASRRRRQLWEIDLVVKPRLSASLRLLDVSPHRLESDSLPVQRGNSKSSLGGTYVTVRAHVWRPIARDPLFIF